MPSFPPLDVDGWLTTDEGLILRDLAADKRVLEVGSFAGLSTIYLAQQAQQVHCVDAFDGRAVPNGRWTLPEFLDNLHRYGVRNKVTAHVGDNNVILPLLRGHWFDLIFIDADHSYAQVTQNIKDAMRLVRLNGVIAFHDYRRPTNPEVTKAVDDFFGGIKPDGLVDTVAWYTMKEPLP